MNIKVVTLVTTAVLIMSSMLMAFLAIKPEGLDARLAFGAIVGFLVANITVQLGRIGIDHEQ